MERVMNKKPPIHTIKAGTQLYRALTKEYLDAAKTKRTYTALDPNPFKGLEWKGETRAFKDGVAVAGRFAPFRSSKGNAVPALYLAETKITAYYEFVLRPFEIIIPVDEHGIEIADPIEQNRKTLSRKEFENLEAAQITFLDDLHFADCRRTYLKGEEDEFWDYAFEDLYSHKQLRSQDAARRLAKYIYETYPDIDGLVWDSVQHDGVVPAYILFGSKRNGSLVSTVMALDEIPVWKPYLRRCVKEKLMVISPDLSSLL